MSAPVVAAAPTDLAGYAAAGVTRLSLGAQSLVTDLVSGFFILFENQYLVGDVVQVPPGGRVQLAGGATTTWPAVSPGTAQWTARWRLPSSVPWSKEHGLRAVDSGPPSLPHRS